MSARCVDAPRDAKLFRALYVYLMNPTRLLHSAHLKNAQHKILLNLPFWIAAALTALVSVFYTTLFKLCEEWVLSQSANPWLLVTAPLAILGSFLLGHFFSKEALGSGIPQVIASVDLSKESSSLLQKILSLPMIVVKIVGSCLCVLGGGVSGREGPTLQISTAIFYQISLYWPKKFPRPPLPSMILAGGAAGLASAFNTPLGGIVFAIEELSKTHISEVRTAVFQAVIIAGMGAQLFFGNYLYLGNSHFSHLPGAVLWQTVLIAAIVGTVGAFFAQSLYVINRWRAQKSLPTRILFTLLAGCLLSLTLWICGPSTLGAGKHIMLEILEDPTSPAHPLLPLSRILGSFFTYIGGVIGGIFAPALASGATLGQFLAQLFGFIHIRLMIMVGMVAFLTGVTRTPFTSFVLVLEMSNSHDIILYLMISSLISNVSARLVSSKSFYEQAAHDILTSLQKK